MEIDKLESGSMNDQLRVELEIVRRSSSDGLLHPPDVVEWARKNPKSALHAKFQWDDHVAAERYRIHQARCLINVVVVKHPDADKPIQAYVHLQTDDSEGGGYRPLHDVLSNAERCALLLEQAIGELNRVKLRYETLKELSGVFEEVAVVEAKARAKRTKAKPKEAAMA